RNRIVSTARADLKDARALGSAGRLSARGSQYTGHGGRRRTFRRDRRLDYTRVSMTRPLRYHFSGIAGAGMNPLAQLMRARGHDVQGSDRSLDHGKNQELAGSLRSLGIVLHPQDGSAIAAGLDRFVYSTAVEDDTPEMRAARTLGVERIARPGLLAEIVNDGRPGVAISGTSGKSTVTGMAAYLVREAGLPVPALGGAALVGEGTTGCFMAGALAVAPARPGRAAAAGPIRVVPPL